jgi:hypothetical protein
MENNIVSLVSEFNASSDLQKNRLFMVYMHGSVPEGYTGSQRNRMRGCEMDIDQ